MAQQFPLVNIPSLINRFALPAFWLSRDNNIKVESWNSNASLTALFLNARVLFFGGGIEDLRFRLPITTSNRSTETNTVTALRNCLLLSCELMPNVTNKRGQTFARILVNDSKYNVDVAVLQAGYVTSMKALGTYFLEHDDDHSIPDNGYGRAIVGTNPDPGAEISESPPTSAYWELMSFGATLTTDATAANRFPKLIVSGGGGAGGGVWFNNTAITASLVVTTWFTAGAQNTQDVVNNGYVHAGIAFNQIINSATGGITTLTKNLQAGDDWGAPTVVVKEWIEL